MLFSEKVAPGRKLVFTIFQKVNRRSGIIQGPLTLSTNLTYLSRTIFQLLENFRGIMSDLKKALEATDLQITSYNPSKQRPIGTNDGSMDFKKFTKVLMEKLGAKLVNHPAIVKALSSTKTMMELVEEYADSELTESGTSGSFIIPKELQQYTLNINAASREESSKRFFLTTPEDLVAEGVSGKYYIDRCKMSPLDAVEIAKAVVPKFMPRAKRGITTVFSKTTQEKIDYYNTYIPAEWERWKLRNPKEWRSLSSRPPKLLMKLLKHLIPSAEERKYFYAWTYTSMKARCYVYLVLCGAPGSGKNRLKLVLRALHGMSNTSDGKKETFGANENKFNGQMEENTLIWFDELKYGPDMEPRLKEYQNDYISIERKGVDATRSSEIYPSMVISNNYPRDNYLPFDSRKFAPLVIANKDLKYSMTSDEITELSDKLDASRPGFDIKFVAQIAKWIESVGPKYITNWQHMEYKGPKFWEIAHASMSRWQKVAIMATSTKNKKGPMPGWDENKKGFLWSKMEEMLRRKKEFDTKDYRDPTTVRAFFDSFRDEKGNKGFDTETAPSADGAFHDFWIIPIGSPTPVISTSGEESAEETTTPKITKEGAKILSKLKRPVGMSEFKWKAMQRKYSEESNGKR